MSLKQFELYLDATSGLPKKNHSVCIHTLEPQIHALDFHSEREMYPLKSTVRSENTL